MFFILIGFFFILVRVQCDNEPPITLPHEFQNRIMASVKEYPTLLHKCTASFISYNVLLTTARCLYCEDECKLFLYALSDHLTDYNQFSKGVLVNITKSVVHPEYERNPQKNDIGLIRIKKNLPDVVVLSLPNKIHDNSGLLVNSFSWQFTENLKDYHLKKSLENIISRSLCSLVLNRYIDYKHICSHRKEYTSLGPFDQGSPLIAEENGHKVILGIFASEVTTHQSKVEIYQTVFPYVDWIRKMISCEFSCSKTIPAGSEKNQLLATSNSEELEKSTHGTTDAPLETTQSTLFQSSDTSTNKSQSLPSGEINETPAEYFTLKPNIFTSSSTQSTTIWESNLDKSRKDKENEFKNIEENKLKPFKWTTALHPKLKKTIFAPKDLNE